VQPALLFTPTSATLSGSLLSLHSATGSGLGGIPITLYRFFFLLSSANCAGLSSASATLSGFFLLRFGATGARLVSTSAARCACDGQAGPGQKSGKAQPGQNFFELPDVHALAPSFCWLGFTGIPSSLPAKHAKDRTRQCQGNGVTLYSAAPAPS
jgi:hypothetical protein